MTTVATTTAVSSPSPVFAQSHAVVQQPSTLATPPGCVYPAPRLPNQCADQYETTWNITWPPPGAPFTLGAQPADQPNLQIEFDASGLPIMASLNAQLAKYFNSMTAGQCGNTSLCCIATQNALAKLAMPSGVTGFVTRTGSAPAPGTVHYNPAGPYEYFGFGFSYTSTTGIGCSCEMVFEWQDGCDVRYYALCFYQNTGMTQPRPVIRRFASSLHYVTCGCCGVVVEETDREVAMVTTSTETGQHSRAVSIDTASADGKMMSRAS